MRVKTLTVMVVLISGMMVAPALMFSFTPGLELAGTVSAASDHVVYVGGTGPGNYSSIQAGIDAATENGTVYVYGDTYHENVVIPKPMFLVGEDRNVVGIDGGTDENTTASVIEISANGVHVSGFTVYNGSQGGVTFTDGVQNCSVTNSMASDNKYGISVGYSTNIKVSECIISDNYHGILLLTGYTEGNTITSNSISHNQGRGIYVESSGGNHITNNTVYHNGWSTTYASERYGVYLTSDAYGNILAHNSLIDNKNNAYDAGNNTWYNATLNEGNYWSNFDEENEGAYDNDSDGVIDTPYTINGDNNQDLYPLAEPSQADNTAPVTTLSLLPAAPNGNDAWYVSTVKATLSAADDLSGVNVTKYRKNEGIWSEYTGGAIILRGGIHTLSYYSIDNAGNEEIVKTKTVRIDTSAPATTLTAFIDNVNTVVNESRWYDDEITVELDGHGGWPSPVTTYYRFVGETRAFQTYERPLNVTGDGVHRLEYFSRDKAGNAEPLHNLTIQIDRTAPQAEVKTPQASYLYVMGRELIPLEGFDNAAVVIGPVPVEIDAVDAVSGIHEVRFYVDDTLQRVDNTTPYTWEWDETVVGPYNIEVEVENGAGDVVDRDIPVIVVNWKT